MPAARALRSGPLWPRWRCSKTKSRLSTPYRLRPLRGTERRGTAVTMRVSSLPQPIRRGMSCVSYRRCVRRYRDSDRIYGDGARRRAGSRAAAVCRTERLTRTTASRATRGPRGVPGSGTSGRFRADRRRGSSRDRSARARVGTPCARSPRQRGHFRIFSRHVTPRRGPGLVIIVRLKRFRFSVPYRSTRYTVQ